MGEMVIGKGYRKTSAWVSHLIVGVERSLVSEGEAMSIR